MLARDLVEDFPLVTAQTDATEAARMVVERGLPGLVVLDDGGKPLTVLPPSEVVRFALPDYVEDDPSLADVFPEAEADQLCRGLEGQTVAAMMRGLRRLPRHERQRPVVPADATVMQVSSVMCQQHSPVVAVVEAGRVLGVITVYRLLGALLPR